MKGKFQWNCVGCFKVWRFGVQEPGNELKERIEMNVLWSKHFFLSLKSSIFQKSVAIAPSRYHLGIWKDLHLTKYL